MRRRAPDVAVRRARRRSASRLAGVLGLIVGSFLNVVDPPAARATSRSSRRRRAARPAARESRPTTTSRSLSWILLSRALPALPRADRPALPGSSSSPTESCGSPSVRYAPSLGRRCCGRVPLLRRASRCSAIDDDFQILPDVITLPGIAVGLALSFVSVRRTPLEAALGAAARGRRALPARLPLREDRAAGGDGPGRREDARHDRSPPGAGGRRRHGPRSRRFRAASSGVAADPRSRAEAARRGFPSASSSRSARSPPGSSAIRSWRATGRCGR